jgi:hypothetical protein
MSISGIVLFVSTKSQSSIPCINFVQSKKLPVQIVRLDTAAARESAANGTYFSITTVPTLCVFLQDGKLQLFSGTPKVMKWFDVVLNKKKQKSVISHDPARSRVKVDSMVFEKARTKHPKPKIVEDSSSDEVFIDEAVEEVNPDFSPIQSPHVSPDVSLDGSPGVSPEPSPAVTKKRSAKTKKKDPVNFDMKTIYSKAQQMQRDRTDTLGYEDDGEE